MASALFDRLTNTCKRINATRPKLFCPSGRFSINFTPEFNSALNNMISQQQKHELDAIFHSLRIGWMVTNCKSISDIDRRLIDALSNGKFKLISQSCSTSIDRNSYAYVAVDVGPLHTEILRWHFPTSRWLKMPVCNEPTTTIDAAIDDAQFHWAIHWRRIASPNQPAVLGTNQQQQSQGPFENWKVVAGEISPREDLVSLVISTTRKNRTYGRLLSLILITNHGRTKYGFLLAPVPDGGWQLPLDEPMDAYVSYRAEEQELHLIYRTERENKAEGKISTTLTWYRYRQRGKRVFWCNDRPKSVILQQHSDASSGDEKFSLYYIRVDSRLCFLLAGVNSDDLCVKIDLDAYQWDQTNVKQAKLDYWHSSIENLDEPIIQNNNTDEEKLTSFPPYLFHDVRCLVNLTKRARIPTRLRFGRVAPLRSLATEAICAGIIPEYLNGDREKLINSLPQNRLLLDSVKKAIARL